MGARKKWERRNKKQSKSNGAGAKAETQQPKSDGSSDFHVEGVDEGIVLASSHNPGARPGVFWPARVIHASEQATNAQSKSKRSFAKNNIWLVFLLPYWNSDGKGWGEVQAEEIFAIESVEANTDTIKEYPFNPSDGIDMAKLEIAFRFTGLPKSLFPRFVNGHRQALALKLYARLNLKKSLSAAERATFGLFNSHPLSSMAPLFPPIVLNLPFKNILLNLPEITRENASSMEENEGILNLSAIVESMKPPACWNDSLDSYSPTLKDDDITEGSPGAEADVRREQSETKPTKEGFVKGLEPLLKTYPNLRQVFQHSQNASIRNLGVSVVDAFLLDESEDTALLKEYQTVENKFLMWTTLKAYGEDLVALAKERKALAEWRRLMERLYRRLKNHVESKPQTLVTTDGHCNLHLTAGTFMERSVRLPAALKAAKNAAKETQDLISFAHTVESQLVDYVQTSLLRRVHDPAYLKRIKRRCMKAKSDDEILMLTEGSDGVGGHDTTGSKGSWEAAVHGVAVAISAVNSVVRGECSNAFCVTRPPGHHAGRKLHAMKAISNGFCLLNPVASVAIHAVSPPIEGGLGLRRVCVIDFDVHHGNGTQDILCSTFDPRFLYISMHAGGIQSGDQEAKKENGESNESKEEDRSIFPGRCGDKSPHSGVLNIPMGTKVTSTEVGNALLNKISPAVESFAPDLVVLSAGFDAHKNDPMQLGSLSAEDFGHITEAACQLAFKSCSGRVVSVLEGGYGVPCCRPQRAPLPPPSTKSTDESKTTEESTETESGEASEEKDDAKDDDNANDNLVCQEISTEELPSKEEHQEAKPQDKVEERVRPQPTRLADLGEYLTQDMDDQVPYSMQRMVEKCNDEGFMECVQSHVATLAKCSSRHSGV